MPSPGSSASSDYGSELDYADAALEAQLSAVDGATAVERRCEVGRVEIALEGDGGAVGGGQAGTGEASEDARLAHGLEAVGLDGGLAATRENLWERFRKWRGCGALSVSDLAGPSWCEWQHFYRLLSKPHLPPLLRPATITTPSGATIAVDTARTVSRERVLDRGREVHAKIEREVMGPVEEVKVEVQGKEEWWALRVLNTAACLETLLQTGRVREVPVVGWVGDFLVFGVCDEIERREIPPPNLPPIPPTPSATAARPPTPSKGKKRAASPAPPATPKKDEQRTLQQFFSPVASPSQSAKGKERAVEEVLDLASEEERDGKEEEQLKRRWTFVLSDTKTRFNRSIPSEAESRPARLQLMLYHRLLTALVHPGSSAPTSGPPPFSWPRLYAHHSLSSSAPLSPAFLSSIAPLLLSTPAFAAAQTLQDFVDVLARYGELLGGAGWLSDEMEISYRLREDDGAGRGKGKGRWRARRGAKRAGGEEGGGRKRRREVGADVAPEPAQAALEADEEEDLRRAIELSLQDGAAVVLDATETPCALVASSSEAPVALRVPDEADTIDSQLEDSQLPFLANPSLPLPLRAAPTSSIDEPPSSSPHASAEAFALPLNSQSDPPAAPAPAGRYNLRRRGPAATAPPGPPPPAAVATPPRAASPASSATLAAPRSPSPSPSPEAPARDPSFIGTSTFRNSPSQLAAWLGSALSYWRSERAPVGVAESETSRCRTCEFEEGCEWRAEKAREAAEGARRRRVEREEALAAKAQGR
ncbi:hypothetical protein JCM10450v2_007471 [Rhodotorula kratochvilovae]